MPNRVSAKLPNRGGSIYPGNRTCDRSTSLKAARGEAEELGRAGYGQAELVPNDLAEADRTLLAGALPPVSKNAPCQRRDRFILSPAGREPRTAVHRRGPGV
jgi:hypothetical protein